MDIPVDSWYNAVKKRHSRRRYTGKTVSEEVIEKIEKVSNLFHRFPGVRSSIILEPPSNLYTGVVGSYGAITNAPHCIALIGDMSNPNVQEVTGYHGEALILEATAQGVDTCWVGGMFKPEALDNDLAIANNERVMAVIPMGYAVQNKSRTERMFSKVLKSHRRKEVKDLLYLGSETPRGWQVGALETARLAPSAVNRQPWRFKVQPNSIEVYAVNGKSKSISPRLDCGIAMLHLEIGALAAGVRGCWELSQHGPVARYVVNEWKPSPIDS